MNLVGKRLRQICQRIGQRALSISSSSALSGDNLGYVERMYEAWTQDPKSVHISWNEYFKSAATGTAPATGTGISPKEISDHLKVLQLVSAYQLRGHEIADLDPLSKINFW